MKNQILLVIFLIISTAFGPVEVFAQKQGGGTSFKITEKSSVKIDEHKLQSELMARQLPYRVALPVGYQRSKKKYPVIYLLHGLTGHFDNWTNQTSLSKYLAGLDYIVVTPEGANGWYCDSISVSNDKYESYIIRELIPEIDKKFRTNATREGRAIAGLSMGGYGSIKFGLKYPEMFSLAGSFSGAFMGPLLSTKTLGNSWPALTESIVSVYGPDDSETRKQNDVYRMVSEITPEKIKALPFFYIDCGTEDFVIQENRRFASLLTEKKIKHEYRQLPGGHDWKYWDKQIQEFLRLASGHLAAN